ncbi:unnamed protein product [Meloidogyne enterolobii]|uniref:Uncharacterized protein n=1 Tax=Meloidogyne enterolobii TaxID=390850 RepID=A0ACB0XYS8_MELEN
MCLISLPEFSFLFLFFFNIFRNSFRINIFFFISLPVFDVSSFLPEFYCRQRKN